MKCLDEKNRLFAAAEAFSVNHSWPHGFSLIQSFYVIQAPNKDLLTNPDFFMWSDFSLYSVYIKHAKKRNQNQVKNTSERLAPPNNMKK